MPSLVPGYEYDVFISYRQNDNRSGWVTQFVEHLREELAATIKDPVSIYFDENPHDGLQDTHHVDKSLEGKLKSVLFIPILSRTYCDPKSFAWNHEFLPFLKLTLSDKIGPHFDLPNGNVASRVLPVQIHDLETRDQQLFESSIHSAIRSLDFTFRSQGVNRPLTPDDKRSESITKTVYRDQINKVANALAEVFASLRVEEPVSQAEIASTTQTQPPGSRKPVTGFIHKLRRRNVLRAGTVYIAFSLLLYLLVTNYVPNGDRLTPLLGILLAIGLVLAMVLAWLFEFSPDGWIRTTSTAAATNPYPSNQRKPFTGAWVVGLLAVMIAYFYYSEKPVENKSIAVLPFEYRGETNEYAYLSEGFTEDIINRLYMLGNLRVISKASSQIYKNSEKPIQEIAKDLEVATILTGSVYRSGNTLKITVQLQDGTSNALIWGEIYQRTVTDLMTVQSEITRQVANVLKVKIDDLVEAKINRRPTESLTAYEHFSIGRNLYNYSNSDSMDRAIAQYKIALVLDPSYAQAYAGLADAYVQLHARFARGLQWIDSAIVAATWAIKLDSGSSDGFKALGAANNYARRYDTAFYFFKKAVEKNQYNAQAIGNLGAVNFLRLNYVEAVRLHKLSAGLNPMSPVSYQSIGWIYRLLGDFPKAEQYLQLSLKRRPLWDTYRELGFTYLSQGKNQEAVELIPNILELGNRGARPLEIAGRIAHFAGDTKAAKAYFMESIQKNIAYKNDPNSISAIGLGQILLLEGNQIESEIYLSHALNLYMEEIRKESPDDDPPLNVSAIHAIMGNRTESLRYLVQAIETNWIDYIQVEKGPYFAGYRDDPEFKAVIAKVKQKVAGLRNQIEETR